MVCKTAYPGTTPMNKVMLGRSPEAHREIAKRAMRAPADYGKAAESSLQQR
jgi:hypothetical protein